MIYIKAKGERTSLYVSFMRFLSLFFMSELRTFSKISQFSQKCIYIWFWKGHLFISKGASKFKMLKKFLEVFEY